MEEVKQQKKLKKKEKKEAAKLKAQEKKREMKAEEKKEKLKQLKQKSKGGVQLFAQAITDKSDSAKLADFLNQHISRHISFVKTKKSYDENVQKAIAKAEKKLGSQVEEEGGQTLIDESNISQHLSSHSIADVVDLLVQSLKEKEKFATGYNIPQIMILTPDTYVVVDLCKELKAKYCPSSDIEPKKRVKRNQVQIKVQKLFSKHISIEEHQSLLNPENVPEDAKVINIFVGTPSRVKKLIDIGAMKVASSKFKFLILDSHVNKKNFSIFDIFETRDDTYDILLYAQKQLFKRKLKLYVA